MAGDDGRRAIKLLGEIGAGKHLWRKPLRAAHEKGEAGRAVIAKLADGLRELAAAELFALAIETYKLVCVGHLAEHHHSFGGGAGGGRGTTRLRHLDNGHRRKSELAAGHLGAAEIVPEQLMFRALFQPAHGSNEKPHGATL